MGGGGSSQARSLEPGLLIPPLHRRAGDFGALSSPLCTVASRTRNQEGQGPVVLKLSGPDGWWIRPHACLGMMFGSQWLMDAVAMTSRAVAMTSRAVAVTF